MKLTDEQLRRAAILAREKELSQLPNLKDCPNYTFSEEFEAQIQDLLTQLEQGTLKAKPVRMGWQYYTKRGVAAIFICFLLTCATMPEAVMAGYEKLVEIIENVFEEFTEFHFGISTSIENEFKPVTLNYLPEGMQEIEHKVSSNGNIYLQYKNGQNYFSLEQIAITEENDVMYLLDTEDVITETLALPNGQATIVSKNGLYQYMLLHNANLLTGDTDLPHAELIKILENIQF